MARDATITLDDVAAAAEAITAEGARPTLRGVRERLGRGSLGTVQKLLAQWQAQRQRAAEVSAINLPMSVQNAIMAFVGEQVAAGKADLEAQLAEARQAVADLAAENERRAAEIEELERALDAER
ncbi:MAG: DNA-binding protein, partial [Halothiobacillaceae bacterium]